MLKQIKLSNFRNYKKVQVDFRPGLNVILGENASGKTNLLEAIALFGILKSFRGVNLPQLVHDGNEIARIEGETDEDLLVFAWGNENENRKLEINGKRSKALDFVQTFPVVLFVPDDLLLLTGEPALRRKFLDSLSVRLNPSFTQTLANYKKTLRQRNILLGQNAPTDQLDFWEEKIAHSGHQIWKKRQEIIEQINAELVQYNLEIKYENKYFAHSENDFRQTLINKRPLDRKIGRTSIGPHRDDWELHFQEKNLRLYGSRGEQRTAIISLKTAEAKMIEAQNKKPILLLDDILSELDLTHQKHIAELIAGYQTILTTTIQPPLDPARIIQMKDGKIIP